MTRNSETPKFDRSATQTRGVRLGVTAIGYSTSLVPASLPPLHQNQAANCKGLGDAYLVDCWQDRTEHPPGADQHTPGTNVAQSTRSQRNLGQSRRLSINHVRLSKRRLLAASCAVLHGPTGIVKAALVFNLCRFLEACCVSCPCAPFSPLFKFVYRGSVHRLQRDCPKALRLTIL